MQLLVQKLPHFPSLDKDDEILDIDALFASYYDYRQLAGINQPVQVSRAELEHLLDGRQIKELDRRDMGHANTLSGNIRPVGWPGGDGRFLPSQAEVV